MVKLNILLFILIHYLKVINDDYGLDQAFEEIIYRVDNWISHGSEWIVEKFYNQHLNVCAYRPLIRSTYIKFPKELQHRMKKCF